MARTQSKAEKSYAAEMEHKAYAPGKFVMLHTESAIGKRPHPDAGRIGKISSINKPQMVVLMFESAERSIFSLVPFGHWMPIPDFMVEPYLSAKGKGFSLNSEGKDWFERMKWKKTPASEGLL